MLLHPKAELEHGGIPDPLPSILIFLKMRLASPGVVFSISIWSPVVLLQSKSSIPVALTWAKPHAIVVPVQVSETLTLIVIPFW